ncbi:hypothetical protein PV703_11250 [Streptomyces sp. ME01-24h]|nr:hypothetical protein [Streptomyces sp. ME01-24h]
MPEIEIPQHIVDLQLATDAAQEVVRAHHRSVGRPVLEWTPEEQAESERLQEAWKAKAAELQDAIEEHGQEVGNSYDWRRALRTAARG